VLRCPEFHPTMVYRWVYVVVVREVGGKRHLGQSLTSGYVLPSDDVDRGSPTKEVSTRSFRPPNMGRGHVNTSSTMICRRSRNLTTSSMEDATTETTSHKSITPTATSCNRLKDISQDYQQQNHEVPVRSFLRYLYGHRRGGSSQT
jgi:hypothetical protein